MRARRLSVRALTLVVAIATASVGRVDADMQTTASLFAACERPAGATWSYDDLLCVFREARRQNAVAAGERRLRALGGGGVEHPWATLVLAHLTLEPDEARALQLYELAAAGFVRSGEVEGEVVARQNLSTIYRRRGQIDAAGLQVDQALKSASAAGAPLTMARASAIEAAHVIDTGGDIGRAHRALVRAERLAFPGGSIGLRRSILFQLANTSVYLGRFDEAIDALERHRALRAEDGSTVDAAAVAFNLLNLRVTMAEARPLPGARHRLIAMAEEVLAEAQTLRRPTIEAPTHRLLGELLRSSDPDRAATHLQRCLEIATPLGHPTARAECLWSLSLHEAAHNAARAEQLSRDAIAAVPAHRGSPLLAYAWQARLRLVWRTLPEEQAVANSLEALDAIERLRSGQTDANSRAALFSNWTRDYYWLTGRLLDVEEPRLAQAFDVGERLRTRVLLEHRARAGLPDTADRDREASRKQLATRIGTVQRRLLSAISVDERRSLLEQLKLFELEQSELGDAGSGVVTTERMPFASLDAVQRTLADREAMLWFSIAPSKDLYDDFGGGSWVVAVTRHGATVHRLDLRPDLDSQVAALIGLLRRRDTDAQIWAIAAQQLGTALLGNAVSELPPSVDRLVIVSDGVVHRLPFEVLRADANSRTVGERFDITLVPSATLWLQLRASEAPASAVSALVFADPESPRTSPDGERPLAPLPWSRREAKAIARTLALEPRNVLEGSAATEHRLKGASLSDIAVLHFAAHARADEAFPDRSAVFLAAGHADEDGWLQPSEIGRLDLRGRLVVLSACESADGRVLSGEGPLSLARAFFAAGAATVIATRWPLRDDDAAFMMERFYRALGTGASAGAALRRARLDAMEAGLPAATWAGVALLGDGVRAPVSAAPQTTWSRFAAAVLALLGIAIASARASRWQIRRRMKK